MQQYLNLPRAVHILCLGMLLNRAGSFFAIFVTIYLRQQLGFSIQLATLAVGLSGLGSMVGSVLGGQLADQLGRRVVMLVALFGAASVLLALSFTSHPVVFLIGMFLLTGIADMYRPAASAMIGDLVSTERRQYSFGLMYVAINLGFAVAPPIGGLLTSYSWKLLFWGDALTTSLFAMLVLFLVPESRPIQVSETPSSNGRASMKAVSYMLRDTTFLVFCGATLLNAFVFMQSMSALPLTMTGLGMTPVQYGCIIALNGVLIVIVQLPLTRWLSRFDRMRVIAIGCCLIAVGFGLTATVTSLSSPVIAFIVFTIVVWTFGEMFQAPFLQAVVADLAPLEYRGRYLGLFTMTYSAAFAVGAPVGGVILQDYGSGVLWSACLGVGLIAACLFIGVRPAVMRRCEQESA